MRFGDFLINRDLRNLTRFRDLIEVFNSAFYPPLPLFQKRLETLNKDFEAFYALCTHRKTQLLESLAFYRFLQDSEEEEAWLVEKMRLVKSQDVGKDLRAVVSLIKKHEVRVFQFLRNI